MGENLLWLKLVLKATKGMRKAGAKSCTLNPRFAPDNVDRRNKLERLLPKERLIRSSCKPTIHSRVCQESAAVSPPLAITPEPLAYHKFPRNEPAYRI